MVKPIKSKKNRKNNNKTSRKGKRLSSKIQKGGSSCVVDYSSSKLGNLGIGTANLHNQPQAAGDFLPFDNKFMLYGGPVPLGQMGGSSKCGDDGVGTSNPKSETFKEYINTLDKQLSFKGGNRNNNSLESNKSNSYSDNSSNDKTLKGGDYTVNPEQFIAGKPVIDGYDHENPPAIIAGKLVMPGATMTGGAINPQLCGSGATRGGSKKSKRNHKSKKYNKKTRKSKSKRYNKKNNRNYKMQKGGEFVSIGSKPAAYSEAFNGPAGVFKYPDDMSQREFGAKQPVYGVNAI